MGTGSGFYDTEMMERTLCPHCFHQVRFLSARDQYSKHPAQVSVKIDDCEPFSVRSLPIRTFTVLECPNCRDVIVWMRWSTCEADRVFERVYPVRSNHPPAPKETPAQIAAAYEEACRVLPVSRNAAAVLARRALQLLLREGLGVGAATLDVEIEAAKGRLPAWLIDGLHSLREMGNFAVHPTKAVLTGEILETSEEEADLTLTLVYAVLGHLYVGRQATVQLSAAVSTKRAKWKAKRKSDHPKGPAGVA